MASELTKERLKVAAIGVGATAVAVLARMTLFRIVGKDIPFLPFFSAVVVAALWGGTRAGVIATLLSTLAAPAWMKATGESFQQVDAINLGVFFLIAAIMVWVVREAHWARGESFALSSQLAEGEARFRHLADNIPQLAWMARGDGHIFWYNRRWFEYTGTTQAEMDGWGWQKVHDPEALPQVVANWRSALERCEPWEDTFPLRGRDGVFRWFLSRAMPLKDNGGNVTLWFGSNTDITEQQRNAEERRQLLESERLARAGAERASTLKDEFLATVSHELRTPLNAILGWTQLLREDIGSASALQEGLEVIERNAVAQARIVGDLLEMSRIVSGNVPLDLQPTDLVGLTRAAVASVQPAAEIKDIRITQELDALPVISADAARLQQVMWNLLNNAVKFTPTGGAIEVSLRRLEETIEIRVRDNGEGITPDFLPRVFDRFRQQDSSTTRRHGGLGLGLAIVKNLVELHGGSVRVESAGRGQGTTFFVSLPLRLASAESQ